MVPSIMSPETTTNPIPDASSSGIRSRRASSPARLLSATGTYSGMVSTVRMKCAWWLVTKTMRLPGSRSGSAAVEHVELGVAVELHGVVVAHAGSPCRRRHSGRGCRGRPRPSRPLRTWRAPTPDRSGRRRPRSPRRRAPRCALTTLRARASLLRIVDRDLGLRRAARYWAVSAPIPRDEPVTRLRFPTSDSAGRTVGGSSVFTVSDPTNAARDEGPQVIVSRPDDSREGAGTMAGDFISTWAWVFWLALILVFASSR